jgi:hypothetical protein
MFSSLRNRSPDTQFMAFFDDDMQRPSAYYSERYTAARYKILGFVARGDVPYSWSSSEHMQRFDVFRPAVTMGEQHRGMFIKIRTESLIPLQSKPVYLRQENGDDGMAILWRTRWSVWYEAQGRWIPVVGTVEPAAIMGNYLYQADGDTQEKCSSRQIVQASERLRVMQGIHAPILVDPALMNGWATGANPQAPPLFPSPTPLHDDGYSNDTEEDEDLRMAIRRSLEPRPPAHEIVPPAGGSARPSVPAAPPPSSAPPASTFAPRYVLELLKRDAVQKGDSCPISMTPFQECESTTVTSCFHLFETESITAWLQGHPTCPVCKQKVAARLVV